MNFFMSGEIDGRYGEELPNKYNEVRNEVENRIKNYISERSYGSEVNDIAIIPIIIKFDSDFNENDWFRERKLFKSKTQEADFRLRIDFDKFLNADKKTCELLLIKNIISSIRILGDRAKKDFNALELENDILSIFNITKHDIDTL